MTTAIFLVPARGWMTRKVYIRSVGWSPNSVLLCHLYYLLLLLISLISFSFRFGCFFDGNKERRNDGRFQFGDAANPHPLLGGERFRICMKATHGASVVSDCGDSLDNNNNKNQ